MKKYIVLEDCGSFSPIRKYQSDNLDDCRLARDLFMKEGGKFVIVEVIE